MISSLFATQASSPLTQQLVAQIRSLRDSNAKFYTSVSKHPEDPAYLQCVALVAMIDMATWINNNHDRAMEEIKPLDFDKLLEVARAAARHLAAVAVESSDSGCPGNDPPSSDDEMEWSDAMEGDYFEWTVTEQIPLEDDLEDHDSRACPLNASSCWICSELFQVRHHPRHSNVDWDAPQRDLTKFRAWPGARPASSSDIQSHDSTLETIDERCPITNPELCWVCCHRHVAAGRPSTSLDSISLD
jgi:hypothetical protein